ncbi:MAG: hypothetical protein ACKO2P_13665, partial [Planctomycetota bacterium]
MAVLNHDQPLAARVIEADPEESVGRVAGRPAVAPHHGLNRVAVADPRVAAAADADARSDHSAIG